MRGTDSKGKPHQHGGSQGASNQASIFGNSFPGFSIIKDRVIKPLLIATEKVVEYYFPEETKKEPSSKSQQDLQKSKA